MLLSLLACAVLQAPLPVQEIQARVPHSRWTVLVGLAGWKDVPEADPLRKSLGERLVLAGGAAPEGCVVTLVAEPNPQKISPVAWRKRFGLAGTEFECSLAACVDASQRAPGAPALSDYHAFTCAAEWCFDLHVSRVATGPDGAEPLARAEFERIVKSQRFLLLRRGWAEDYPAEVGKQMTLAALAGPGRAPWKENVLGKRADDWVVHFVEAELLHEEHAPVEAQLAEYSRALELVQKLEKPGPREVFATAIACDGYALALHDAGRHAESIAPLERGCSLLTTLGRKERGALSYNLACAQARSGQGEAALRSLGLAIAVEARFREAAARDEDLASLRGTPQFQKLLDASEAKPAR